MGSPCTRKYSRLDSTESHTPPTRKRTEQLLSPTHPLYRTKPCHNFAMGYCRYGDNCAYLHMPPTPPSQPHSPLSMNYFHPVAPCMNVPSHSFSAEQAILHHLPNFPPSPCPTVTDGTSEMSSSVEDLTAMMQQYSINPIVRSGHADEIPLPPVPPCTPATYDYYVPSPGVSTISTNTSPSPSGDRSRSPRRSRSRSVTYGISLFKTKPCTFYATKGRCLKGDRCNFIHESPERDAEKACSSEGKSSPSPKSRSSPSRPSPISVTPSRVSRVSTPTPVREIKETNISQEREGNDDDEKKDFHPITWRVIGGGVKMSGHREICQDYIAGRCNDGVDCKYAHPEHDLYEEPICLSPTSFFPTSAHSVRPTPIICPINAPGPYFDGISPISPYYFDGLSTPTLTATPSTATSSSWPSVSPPQSPPSERRKLPKRKSPLKSELSVDTSAARPDQCNSEYRANRVFDGRTLREIQLLEEVENLVCEDAQFLEDDPATWYANMHAEAEKAGLERLEPEVEVDEGVEEEMEGGLFSPRSIVRPMSTPPTPVSVSSSKKIAQLFNAEMP
ncbi:unnamed protein product [Somion occarium]|uniref:C3H1-type domain-containing protein n=1 Tax=Somion occarium TaxID=3059160 RepID=A0ABP1DYJ4_9APHY